MNSEEQYQDGIEEVKKVANKLRRIAETETMEEIEESFRNMRADMTAEELEDNLNKFREFKTYTDEDWERYTQEKIAEFKKMMSKNN